MIMRIIVLLIILFLFSSVLYNMIQKGRKHFLLLKHLYPERLFKFDSFIELFFNIGWSNPRIMFWFYAPLYYRLEIIDLADPVQKKLDQKLHLTNKYLILSITGYFVVLITSILIAQ